MKGGPFVIFRYLALSMNYEDLYFHPRDGFLSA